MNNRTIDKVANIWNGIVTAWRLVVIFCSTIGVFGLGIYFIYTSQFEVFDKPYEEQMYMGMGVVTLMVGIVLIGVQILFMRQAQKKLKRHEK